MYIKIFIFIIVFIFIFVSLGYSLTSFEKQLLEHVVNLNKIVVLQAVSKDYLSYVDSELVFNISSRFPSEKFVSIVYYVNVNTNLFESVSRSNLFDLRDVIHFLKPKYIFLFGNYSLKYLAPIFIKDNKIFAADFSVPPEKIFDKVEMEHLYAFRNSYNFCNIIDLLYLGDFYFKRIFVLFDNFSSFYTALDIKNNLSNYDVILKNISTVKDLNFDVNDHDIIIFLLEKLYDPPFALYYNVTKSFEYVRNKFCNNIIVVTDPLLLYYGADISVTIDTKEISDKLFDSAMNKNSKCFSLLSPYRIFINSNSSLFFKVRRVTLDQLGIEVFDFPEE